MIRIFPVLFLMISLPSLFASATDLNGGRATGQLPKDWYVLPENEKLAASDSAPRPTPEAANRTLARIYQITADAMDQVPDATEPPPPSPTWIDRPRPADWVPWHLHYFITDLSITLQGLIGILTVQGTPAVSVIWRKKDPFVGESPTEHSAAPPQETQAFASPIAVQLTHSDPILAQLDKVEALALASGRIKDRATFRKNLRNTAIELQQALSAIDSHSNSPWWVSGFRFDFSAGASGNIYPYLHAGGDLRLRFDWKRTQKNTIAAHPRSPSLSAVRKRYSKLGASLKDFVVLVESHLESQISADMEDSGFQAYAFRVGIGMSATGRIGIAKGSAAVMGHLNFSRDIPKPGSAVRPALAMRSPIGIESLPPLLLIEVDAPRSHLEFANARKIVYSQSNWGSSPSKTQTSYQVSPTAFRRGLKKALQLGAFFAKPRPKKKLKKWKIYEIRVSLDLSISGDVALVALGGLASTEINFYNENF